MTTKLKILEKMMVCYLKELKNNNELNKVTIVMSCEIKMNNSKSEIYLFNTYRMLKLAKMNKEAIFLKNKCMQMFNIDMSKEPKTA